VVRRHPPARAPPILVEQAPRDDFFPEVVLPGQRAPSDDPFGFDLRLEPLFGDPFGFDQASIFDDWSGVRTWCRGTGAVSDDLCPAPD
jgi:hypothetical protein